MTTHPQMLEMMSSNPLGDGALTIDDATSAFHSLRVGKRPVSQPAMSGNRHKLHERMGKFVVEKQDLDTLPDWLQQMMAAVVVLRAHVEYCDYEYVALCPQFAAVAPSPYIPRYRPVVEDGRFLRFEPA